MPHPLIDAIVSFGDRVKNREHTSDPALEKEVNEALDAAWDKGGLFISLNDRDEEGNTASIVTAKHFNDFALKWLKAKSEKPLVKSVNFNVANNAGDMPIHYALRFQEPEGLESKESKGEGSTATTACSTQQKEAFERAERMLTAIEAHTSYNGLDFLIYEKNVDGKISREEAHYSLIHHALFHNNIPYLKKNLGTLLAQDHISYIGNRKRKTLINSYILGFILKYNFSALPILVNELDKKSKQQKGKKQITYFYSDYNSEIVSDKKFLSYFPILSNLLNIFHLIEHLSNREFFKDERIDDLDMILKVIRDNLGTYDINNSDLYVHFTYATTDASFLVVKKFIDVLLDSGALNNNIHNCLVNTKGVFEINRYEIYRDENIDTFNKVLNVIKNSTPPYLLYFDKDHLKRVFLNAITGASIKLVKLVLKIFPKAISKISLEKVKNPDNNPQIERNIDFLLAIRAINSLIRPYVFNNTLKRILNNLDTEDFQDISSYISSKATYDIVIDWCLQDPTLRLKVKDAKQIEGLACAPLLDPTQSLNPIYANDMEGVNPHWIPEQSPSKDNEAKEMEGEPNTPFFDSKDTASALNPHSMNSENINPSWAPPPSYEHVMGSTPKAQTDLNVMSEPASIASPTLADTPEPRPLSDMKDDSRPLVLVEHSVNTRSIAIPSTSAHPLQTLQTTVASDHSSFPDAKDKDESPDEKNIPTRKPLAIMIETSQPIKHNEMSKPLSESEPSSDLLCDSPFSDSPTHNNSNEAKRGSTSESTHPRSAQKFKNPAYAKHRLFKSEKSHNQRTKDVDTCLSLLATDSQFWEDSNLEQAVTVFAMTKLIRLKFNAQTANQVEGILNKEKNSESRRPQHKTSSIVPR